MSKYNDDIMAREMYEGEHSPENADGRIGQAYHAIDSLARELGWQDDYHVKQLLLAIDELNEQIWGHRLDEIPDETKEIIANALGVRIP